MRTILKWIGILLGGLIGLVVVALIAVYTYTNSRMNHIYELELQPVAIPTDEAALARGKHVATIRGCVGCHGQDLSGKVVVDAPPALIVGSNLTSGQGGISAEYSDENWIRAIRHGIGADGKALIFMPSHQHYFLSDEELGALTAYLKSVPPVDNDLPETSVKLLGRVLYLAGQFDLLPAENIDHTGMRPVIPKPGITVEYGANLAIGCTACHGTKLSGGPIPGVPSDWPPAANLTPAGALGGWSEADFVTSMRTGVTPTGHQIDPQYMPWPQIGQMTDQELSALWLFLDALPPTISGNR